MLRISISHTTKKVRSPHNYLCVPIIISFKIAKKEEIVRRLEGDIANLQETVKSYAEEVRQSCFTINVRLIHSDASIATFEQEKRWQLHLRFG